MSGGSYSGTYTYVGLSSAFATVTFTASAVVDATGNAVHGGAANAYTLFNDGSIVGAANGIYFEGGAAVTNGSTSVTDALIKGGEGIRIAGAAGAVANFATIQATIYAGVDLLQGGTVINGAAGSTKALIEGAQSGISIGGSAGTVENFGTILGTVDDGVYLSAGGAVENEAGAYISGFTGIQISKGAGSVYNAGYVVALGATGSAIAVAGSNSTVENS
ncbi:MAG TPA: hypothetical protein VKS60_25990, partial [Stellaceae bacterium]|nr:hypothetical protein [Stellaceae bacterium]